MKTAAFILIAALAPACAEGKRTAPQKSPEGNQVPSEAQKTAPGGDAEDPSGAEAPTGTELENSKPQTARVDAGPQALSLVDAFDAAGIALLSQASMKGDGSAPRKGWDPNFDYTGIGGAGVLPEGALTFAGGAPAPRQSLFMAPPVAAQSFVQVSAILPLDATRHYWFHLKAGLSSASSAGGANFKVMVSARSFDQPDGAAETATLYSGALAGTSPKELWIPLGLWPQRPDFKLSFRATSVAAVAASLVIGGPELVPGQNPLPSLGIMDNALADSAASYDAEATYKRIEGLNPRWIRMAASGYGAAATKAKNSLPFADNVMAALRAAKAAKIKALVTIIPEIEDYNAPFDAGENWPRSLPVSDHILVCGGAIGSQPLPQLDRQKFYDRVAGWLAAFKAEDLAPQAIQIGNELDNPCNVFGISYTTPYDLNGASEVDQAVRATIDTYGEILQESARMIRQTLPQTAVVAMGMDTPDWYLAEKLGRAVPARVGRIMAQDYLTRLKPILEASTDAIALHVYPDPRQAADDARKIAAVGEGASLVDRPVWITECGYNKSLLENSDDRYRRIMGLIEGFASLPFSPVANVFYYAYDDAWGIYDRGAAEPRPEARIFQHYKN